MRITVSAHHSSKSLFAVYLSAVTWFNQIVGNLYFTTHNNLLEFMVLRGDFEHERSKCQPMKSQLCVYIFCFRVPVSERGSGTTERRPFAKLSPNVKYV